MSNSRLDRLVILLETGSSQLIRDTAAQQLADVQKAHPDELFNLLTRIVPYLRSRSWDTRTAAAKAIGGIVDHAPRFEPVPDDSDGITEFEKVGKTEQEDLKAESDDGADGLPAIRPADDQLTLETLDVEAILQHGKELLSSAGKQYDYLMAGLSPAERLAHQKKSLTARLGLGGEYMEQEIVDETDLVASNVGVGTLPVIPKSEPTSSSPQMATENFSASEPGGEAMSKRQLNMLKRRRKEELKRDNKKFKYDFARQDPDTAAVKADPQQAATELLSLDRKTEDDDASKLVSEFKGAPVIDTSEFQTNTEDQSNRWPFERLCEYLTVDLFDPNWEIRHGAALGLREILRSHGAGAGRVFGKTHHQNNALNEAWLDDMSCRLCCVFMLDRFADYGSDNAVAPIRETAGQALGALLPYLSDGLLMALNRILYRLVMQKDIKIAKSLWHAAHGGMIGMRYLVAVRRDLITKENVLMDGILECVLKGLRDHDDDVRSLSAATLIPVVSELVSSSPPVFNDLIVAVWACVCGINDDLSSSTGHVMDLLAKLCSFPDVLAIMQKNAARDPSQAFTELVPQLFQYLRHTITSVRLAVLRALLTFLDLQDNADFAWVSGTALRLVYQNLLVERNEPVLKLSSTLWTRLIEVLSKQDRLSTELDLHLEPMFTLVLHPIGVSRDFIPMDTSLFVRAAGGSYAPIHGNAAARPSPKRNGSGDNARKSRKQDKRQELAHGSQQQHNIDGPVMAGDVDLVGSAVLYRGRLAAARALAFAMSVWPKDNRPDTFAPLVRPGLESTYSSTQFISAVVVEEYAKAHPESDLLAESFATTVKIMVEGERPAAYGDLVSYLRIVRSQCQSLINVFRDRANMPQSKLPTIVPVLQGEPGAGDNAFGIADARRIATADFERLKKTLTTAQRLTSADLLITSKTDVDVAIEEATAAKHQRDLRIMAAAAAALVALRRVPKKPQMTIKALMDSVRDEENVEFQARSALAVTHLIDQLCSNGRIKVVDKIVGNLVKFSCMDTSETPAFHMHAQKDCEILSLQKDEDIQDRPDMERFEREAKAARITRRGAKDALERLCALFGPRLFEQVPMLETLIKTPIEQCFVGELPADITSADASTGQTVVDAFSTLRALVGSFDPALHGFVAGLLPLICKALRSQLSVLRYVAAKCLATVCSVLTVDGFTMLVEKVLPSIGNPNDLYGRQGIVECIYHLIHVMKDQILPYVIFLLVPVLGRMSDADHGIRLLATTSFASLVKLVPLEAGIPDPPNFSDALLQGREDQRKFISQMLDPKKVEPFTIPVAIKAELRSYQQDGVNWLAFLNRYNLHGVLCDDMGLGKTLQTLCIVASDHHMRAEKFAETGDENMRPTPSIIVCPPTLSGHWQQELRTYAPFLNPVAYVGPPAQRNQVRSQLSEADVVITSYDICRNDADVLTGLNWNYCVLDEGHLIKNPRAKTSMAVKRLASNHRLILSGTPIQNNVLELWSLFDFLMPGFLGTEKIFQDRFAKPIAASRFSKSSPREQEAGALAIEALHKQVLPFLLRRLKEEVLDDLPPKIIQNYYCDLSDLQKKLFEDFTRKEGKKLQEAAGSGEKEAKQHIFQALQYMRKLCNSPALVMKEGHKQYAATQQYLAGKKTSLQDPVHAPKLLALRDLLVDCGIGVSTPSAGANEVPTADQAVSPHRALIFCQMKEMLDMVESTVLRKLLPSVTFSRLDGSVEASRRQDIVNRFNSDPSIDCLLLTTSVGGLGLNLTGADTVIFVEHDWNPQKDMQAMDRAHRIGQKKVVNVYRLVTRGTLEEKILNLQRFKIDVASTVVNQQNAGLGTMETDQILDLFSLGETDPNVAAPGAATDGADDAEAAVDAEGNVREKGKKGILDDLSELWDEKQYEEFNLDGFIAGMKA